MKLDGLTPNHAAAEYLLLSVPTGRTLGVPRVSTTIKSLVSLLKVRAPSLLLVTCKIPSFLVQGSMVCAIEGSKVIDLCTSWALAGTKLRKNNREASGSTFNMFMFLGSVFIF